MNVIMAVAYRTHRNVDTAVHHARMCIHVSQLYYVTSDFFFLQVFANVTNGSTNSVCLEAIPYPDDANDICRTALKGILSSEMGCDSNGTLLVRQIDADSTARTLLLGLQIQNPSEKCMEAVIPTLCLHFFGLCDSSGVSLQPTAGQCREIRDELCVEEWNFALRAKIELPICEKLPEERASCPTGNDSDITSMCCNHGVCIS